MKRRRFFWVGIFVIIISLYFMIPPLVANKPEIEEILPSTVMANSSFNENNSIRISGKNFDNIIGVYLNGQWEPDCMFLSQNSDTLEIVLPGQYYNKENKLSIQLQVKVNSDLSLKSNKRTFTVLSDDEIAEQKINGVTPDILQYDEKLYQSVEIYGKNFSENSVVTVDDVVMETEYVNGHLNVLLPFSTWYKSQTLGIRVLQYYDGYSTSIHSGKFYLDTDSEYVEFKDKEKQEKNNLEFLLKYLAALNNRNYIIFMAVKDESSCAMTEEIVNGMHELGLKENLMLSGAQSSYIAVIDGLNLIYEEISKELLCYHNDDIGIPVYIESACFNAGNNSSIQINGVEYSVNERGLNIVVYDKIKARVVDSVCFDLYSGIELMK